MHILDPRFHRPPQAYPDMRIGLLGGSFNPGHAGHRHLSLMAMQRLSLSKIWWLVTPSNPLKSKDNTPSLEERLRHAERVAGHPNIAVTACEASRPTTFTSDTLKWLKVRAPESHFVWLMGGDNLSEFHRWKNWEEIFMTVPIAVIDRPQTFYRALSSLAARKFAKSRISQNAAPLLTRMIPPAWVLLTPPTNKLSSTEIRSKEGQGESSKFS